MSKVLKVLLIIAVIGCLFINIAMATEDEAEDVQDSATEENVSEDESSTSASTYSDISAQVTKVNPLSNLPEANLGLNNILNIILISIGVLLILFAIAILIRLKKTGT